MSLMYILVPMLKYDIFKDGGGRDGNDGTAPLVLTD